MGRGMVMTNLHPPGKCSLEITPEDVPPPDPGVHARLITPYTAPQELIRELQAIHAQLCAIAIYVDAISPRVQATLNAIMGDEASGDIKMNDILQLTATHYDVTPREIRSGRRNIRLVRPRHIVMYLCKTITARSYPEIAMFLGGRDHTTVMHAVKVITKLMKDDADFATEVGLLAGKILKGGHDGYQD
jgi:chromosomal replication initiation ATPase DnaA